MLYDYKQRLIELNNQYGTTLGIPDVTATGGDYSEIVSVFSSMTIEEFDSYILSIIDGSIYEGNDNTIKPDNNLDDFIMPLAYIKEQRYYYKSGSNNYLFITSNMQYADGYDRYNSIRSFGESVISYPALKQIHIVHLFLIVIEM